jgi:hypothetical protein
MLPAEIVLLILTAGVLALVVLFVFVAWRIRKTPLGGVVRTSNYSSAYQNALKHNTHMWRLGVPTSRVVRVPQEVWDELIKLPKKNGGWSLRQLRRAIQRARKKKSEVRDAAD